MRNIVKSVDVKCEMSLRIEHLISSGVIFGVDSGNIVIKSMDLATEIVENGTESKKKYFYIYLLLYKFFKIKLKILEFNKYLIAF